MHKDNIFEINNVVQLIFQLSAFNISYGFWNEKMYVYIWRKVRMSNLWLMKFGIVEHVLEPSIEYLHDYNI